MKTTNECDLGERVGRGKKIYGAQYVAKGGQSQTRVDIGGGRTKFSRSGATAQRKNRKAEFLFALSRCAVAPLRENLAID
jgi:hypothetical protein